ncbi:hypothetical protein EBR11_05025 [bacterium]|nr:hypothetical protein [bacterium]
MHSLTKVALVCLFGTAFSSNAQSQVSGQSPSVEDKQPAVRHQNTLHHPPVSASKSFGRLGDPINGLNASQLAAFTEGRDDFETAETIEGGLGPIFNRDSCVACHKHPTSGGSSPINVTRFGLVTDHHFDPLESLGGSLLQNHAIDPRIREKIPPQANHVSFRNSTPLYGLGLIEAIPESTLLENARKNPGDNIKGRASLVKDITTNRIMVGRFGWKAQQATLLAFCADAYVNELGITNRFFPKENAPNGNQRLLAIFDKVADPEDQIDPVSGKGDIDRVTDFITLLGPPPSKTLSPSAAAGRIVFQNLGCALCHIPSMNTDNRSPIVALRNREVRLYSDLLLHHMGSLGDGVVQGDASADEMRTAPLWGLKHSAPYLHDGSAQSYQEAIEQHDGEAKASRARYLRLSKIERDNLNEFLDSI